MKILVCVKYVPAKANSEMKSDFTLKRDGGPQQLNLADECAVETALRLANGGCVTVLSMGAPSCEPALRDFYALGVSRSVLLSDPLLAGADSYATAVALCAAVKKLGPFDLLLCGRRALDGETGQVPAEMAALLGWPCVTNVAKVEIENGAALCTRLLEDKTRVLRAALPAAVSLCEYSCTLRLPLLSGIRAAKRREVCRFSAQEIGLSAAECGRRASRTTVVAVVPQTAGRRKVTMLDSAAETAQCILSAAAAVREFTARGACGAPPRLYPAAQKRIGVVCADASEAVLGLIQHAALLAEGCAAGVEAAALFPVTEKEKRALSSAGALSLCEFAGAATEPDERVVAEALAAHYAQTPMLAVLSCAGIAERSILPMTAALLKTGLTADCTEIALLPDGTLLQTRPAFGSSILARIRCETLPQMATVRPGIYSFCKETAGCVSEAQKISLPLRASSRVTLLSEQPLPRGDSPAQAKVIFAGGMGLGSQAAFEAMTKAALQCGAAAGATRDAVTAGWLPYSCQIGQTGTAVHPAVYAAFGIRGAAQHIAGMNRSRCVVAVNTDPLAPIFDFADYGYRGDACEVLREIERLLPGAAQGAPAKKAP